MNYDNITNKNRKYVLPYLKTKPSKVSDIVNDKYEKIHISLYKQALNRLVKSYIFKYTQHKLNDKDFKPFELYTFIEIRDSEYDKPSSVVVINKNNPAIKNTYYLKMFWDQYNYNANNKQLSDIQINKNILTDNGESIENNNELVNIDYVRGIAKIRNRITETEMDVDLSFINSDTKKSDDLSLSGTFAYKYDIDKFKNLFI